jgi:chemotaxis signal transduction protein
MPKVASNDDVWNIVFSMIFAVGERKIVLPRSMVAEVRSWREPTPASGLSSKQPSWLLGELGGGDQPIPLIAMGKFLSRGQPPAAKARVVIVNALSDSLAKTCRRPQFAFVCQGFPTLIEVRQPVDQPTELDMQLVNPKANDFVAAEFNVGALELSVPNFPAIEARLATLYRPKTAV